MKLFQEPELTVSVFAVEDVITDSVPQPGENELPAGGGL